MTRLISFRDTVYPYGHITQPKQSWEYNFAKSVHWALYRGFYDTHRVEIYTTEFAQDTGV